MGKGNPGRRGAEFGADLAGSLERALLRVLPFVAVGAVAAAVLVVGRPRPVLGVRAWGGPTEGASLLSFRVEVVERNQGGERPMARKGATVDVVVEGRRVHRAVGALDASGAVQVAVALQHALGPAGAAVHVALEGRQEPIAREVVRVPKASWAGPSTRLGGWVTKAGNGEGGLSLRAAAARGVFAVPFPDPLVVQVSRDGRGVAGVTIRIRAEGADVEAASTTTDPRGEARVLITPKEHTVALFVEAKTADGASAHLELSPAVIPGALHAELRGKELLIRAPIARELAYVALVGEGERFYGAAVPLKDDGRGGALGSFLLPTQLTAAAWAVVSSEPDLRSPARVGWPIGDAEGAPPRSTFDVADVPWFDTLGAALEREESRARHLRILLAGVASAALALTALLVARRAQAAEVVLAAHLARMGEAQPRDGRGRLGLLAAVVSLILAALLAFAFVLSR